MPPGPDTDEERYVYAANYMRSYLASCQHPSYQNERDTKNSGLELTVGFHGRGTRWQLSVTAVGKRVGKLVGKQSAGNQNAHIIHPTMFGITGIPSGPNSKPEWTNICQ